MIHQASVLLIVISIPVGFSTVGYGILIAIDWIVFRQAALRDMRRMKKRFMVYKPIIEETVRKGIERAKVDAQKVRKKLLNIVEHQYRHTRLLKK